MPYFTEQIPSLVKLLLRLFKYHNIDIGMNNRNSAAHLKHMLKVIPNTKGRTVVSFPVPRNSLNGIDANEPTFGGEASGGGLGRTRLRNAIIKEFGLDVSLRIGTGNAVNIVEIEFDSEDLKLFESKKITKTQLVEKITNSVIQQITEAPHFSGVLLDAGQKLQKLGNSIGKDHSDGLKINKLGWKFGDVHVMLGGNFDITCEFGKGATLQLQCTAKKRKSTPDQLKQIVLRGAKILKTNLDNMWSKCKVSTNGNTITAIVSVNVFEPRNFESLN